MQCPQGLGFSGTKQKHAGGVGVPVVPAAHGKMAAWIGSLLQATAPQESPAGPTRGCRAPRSSRGTRQELGQGGRG